VVLGGTHCCPIKLERLEIIEMCLPFKVITIPPRTRSFKSLLMTKQST
jgi:hypothetical protein